MQGNNSGSNNPGMLIKQNQMINGWSWGEIKIQDNLLKMESNKQDWFKIDTKTISNVIVANKNEVGIEFYIDDEDVGQGDYLSEMRLVIPAKNQESEEGVREDENTMKVDEENKENKDHNADNIKEEIMKYVNIGALEEAIAVVQEVPMVTPRGKFDFHFLKNILKIHGNSFDYKINYRNMSRAFMLPKPDGIHIAFVIGLISPLKQGKTSYPYLVFQIKNNQEKTIDLNLPDDPEKRNKIIKNEIDNQIKGQLYDILAKLVKTLIGIKIVIPSNFKSYKKLSSVKCSVKASEGFLFPLERSLIFIDKPVIYISLDEVTKVDVMRLKSAANQKSFDIIVFTRKDEIQFSGIDKNEFDEIVNYFKNKNVKIGSENGEDNIDMHQTTISRRRKAPEEVPMELPSDESLVNDFESEDDNYDMDVDDSENSEKLKKKKKKKN